MRLAIQRLTPPNLMNFGKPKLRLADRRTVLRLSAFFDHTPGYC